MAHGVCWNIDMIEFFFLSAYDFTKEYHLYKGTNNTHTVYMRIVSTFVQMVFCCKIISGKKKIHHIISNLARPTLSE